MVQCAGKLPTRRDKKIHLSVTFGLSARSEFFTNTLGWLPSICLNRSMTTPLQIIVVGTSAGGFSALQKLLRGIPNEINAAIFIVQHTSPDGPGLLPQILRPSTTLPVTSARNHEPVRRGQVYVAPPNRHMILVGKQVCTTNGPKENHARPAIDPLFRSAALHYGRRVIGVILSGMLDDGTAGLWAVKERGGIAIVQNPGDADFHQMPLNALAHVPVDHCLPVVEIGPLIGRLVAESRPETGGPAVTKDLELETRISNEQTVSKRELLQISDPTVFTCPECHGVLLQLKRSGILRFRCHTGHAFSVQSLLGQLTNDVEINLWTAIRSIEETVLLLDHVAKHLYGKQTELTADDRRLGSYFQQTARAAERRAGALRELVLQDESLTIEQLESVEKTDPSAPIPERN